MDRNTQAPVKAPRVKTKKSPVYLFFKRALDIFLSIFALILLSPLFLVVSVAIAVEDGAPVIFKQRRVGKDKKVFNMYKFRSMRRNAEDIHKEVKVELGKGDVAIKLKDKEDPRVTRVGRFIRRTNIDELPQLINILKGEMSFVGPRPYVTYEVEEAEARNGDIFDERYDMAPGLTCYWQTTFSGRGKISYEDRMVMDIKYVKEANFFIDVKLIFLTAIYTVIGKAGY